MTGRPKRIAIVAGEWHVYQVYVSPRSSISWRPVLVGAKRCCWELRKTRSSCNVKWRRYYC